MSASPPLSRTLSPRRRRHSHSPHRDADPSLASSSSSSRVSGGSRRPPTALCEDYLSKHGCENAQCTLRHTREECRQFRLGSCPRGVNCTYAHVDEHGELIAPARYPQPSGRQLEEYLRNPPRSREPCRQFLRGHCPRGAACPHLHEESSQRKRERSQGSDDPFKRSRHEIDVLPGVPAVSNHSLEFYRDENVRLRTQVRTLREERDTLFDDVDRLRDYIDRHIYPGPGGRR